MNIMVAFNDGYALPTKVMLKSLIVNNEDKLDIYVLYINLSEDSIKSIRELDDGKSVFINLIQIDGSFFENVPVMEHYSKEAYIRLFAHLFIDTSIDRILWLDGDMIINKSLKEFYALEFENKIFIANEDMDLAENEFVHNNLNMPLDVPYVNSGVMLINMQKAREIIDENDIVDYIRKNYKVIRYVDQDVFNGLMYSQFKVVEAERMYNYYAWAINRTNRKNILEKAYIIHYVGRSKPWKKGYRYGGFRLWWSYAFMCGKEYRRLFLPIFISSIKGKTEHSLAVFLRSKMPALYELAEKTYYRS